MRNEKRNDALKTFMNHVLKKQMDNTLNAKLAERNARMDLNSLGRVSKNMNTALKYRKTNANRNLSKYLPYAYPNMKRTRNQTEKHIRNTKEMKQSVHARVVGAEMLGASANTKSFNVKINRAKRFIQNYDTNRKLNANNKLKARQTGIPFLRSNVVNRATIYNQSYRGPTPIGYMNTMHKPREGREAKRPMAMPGHPTHYGYKINGTYGHPVKTR